MGFQWQMGADSACFWGCHGLIWHHLMIPEAHGGLRVAGFEGVTARFGTALHFQRLTGLSAAVFGGVTGCFSTTLCFQQLTGADSGWFWGVMACFGTILCFQNLTGAVHSYFLWLSRVGLSPPYTSTSSRGLSAAALGSPQLDFDTDRRPEGGVLRL